MKKLISDKELVSFTMGQSSRSETKKIYEKVIANNETDMLFHLQMANLITQSELADDLLGEDTFMPSEQLDLQGWAMAAKNISIKK